jgi:predicted cupin superfamily sugar epimerase
MLVGTTREELIRELELAPLPVEGGMFCQTYKDEHSTAIYYLVGPGDFSGLHRLTYPEVFHFYAGAAARMLLLNPDGSVEEPVLGVDFTAGERPQVVVSPGTWQGTETLGEWTLLGTTMAPGYTEECFELGDCRDLVEQYPAARKRIERLTRNEAS